MDSNLFRKKSLKQIQSPDNLKEYIKVINPSLWIIFIAIFLLLAGAFVWGTMGKIEDKVSVTALVKNGEVLCDYNESAKEEMKAVINGINGTVSSVSTNAIKISLEEKLSDGVYMGYIVLGEISPISFVFN